MKCSKCLGEWTPDINDYIIKCPYCRADLLSILIDQAKDYRLEVVLGSIIELYGSDILFEEQRLTAVLSDYFVNAGKNKKSLTIAINAPMLLLLIDQIDKEKSGHRIREIQTSAFYSEEEKVKMVKDRLFRALGLVAFVENKENSFQAICRDGFYGIRNPRGEMITPFKYDECICSIDTKRCFFEGLARVVLDGKYGYVNKDGKEVIPLIYEFADTFIEDVARVSSRHEYGFIDKKGNVIIPLRYSYAEVFSEGLAKVKCNERYGFIDKQGNEVMPCKYEDARSFTKGLANVKLNGKRFYIDKTGEEVNVGI